MRIHTTVTPGGNGGRGGGLNNISLFCEHYNGFLLHFITHFFLPLACFPVSIVHTPVQNIAFSILTHNKKNSVGNMYILVQKGQNG